MAYVITNLFVFNIFAIIYDYFYNTNNPFAKFNEIIEEFN